METSSTATALDQVARPSDEARALVDAERMRIERELHDVVAFSFATISVAPGAPALEFATNKIAGRRTTNPPAIESS